jgi:hypothetical protein
MSDEEFLRNQREMFYDKKMASMLEKASEEVPASAPDTGASGGGGLDLGGDSGGGLDLGGDTGGDTTAAADTPDAGGDEGGTDSALLASPGNRSRDKDGKVSRGDGKGRRKVKAVKDSEAGRAARTNSTKAVTDPVKRMFKDPVASIINTVYESGEKQIYDKEEKQLFNTSHDIKVLLESMEPKEK